MSTPAPENPEEITAHSEPHSPSAEVSHEPSRAPGWFGHVTSLLFIVFCVEIGLFLLVYPWTDWWADNYFARMAPEALESGWREFWISPYVRGALSGLGAINLWIAVAEVFRMFSGKGDPIR